MIRCVHCGLLHVSSRTVCPTTGLAVQGVDRRARTRTATGTTRERGKVRAMVGRVLDQRYRIVAAIGQGGMGTVYEAVDLGSGGRVAVKVLKPEHVEKADAVTRLRHEAQVAGGLRHENICAVFDVGQLEDGSPYVVMERLLGETLATRLSRAGPVGVQEIVEVTMQVLEGLRAAHGRRIIHRDMKPDNVFLAEVAGRTVAKVVDFGISKGMADDKPHNLTRTGMVMGTPYYMSPEQAMGERDLDGRVDVWGVGVTMYEALTGVRPFVAKNYNALLVQILTAAPAEIKELRPDVPDGLAVLIRKALEKRRERRIASVVEFRGALAALRRRPKAPAAPSASGLPRITMFGATEDSTSSDEEVTVEMARENDGLGDELETVASDQEVTIVDGPPSFADSDHAATERRRR